MDERPTDTGPGNSVTPRRRGRRLVAAVAVAGMLAAIPAGAALAGDSDNSSGNGGSSAGQRGDGDRDRGDCPKKGGQERRGSAQI